ncbi:MAG: PAS domain-containing protein, partial [Bellilinea sp.]
MKDKFSSPFQALWGKSTPKIDTGHLAQMFLDLFPEPALLVDANQGKILHANSPFLVLTAFSLAEVISTPLADLFELIDPAIFSDNDEHQIVLKPRNRPALPVVIRNNQVEPVNQWVVVRVTLLAKHQQSSPQWQEMILNMIKSLPGMIRAQNIDSTLDKITEIPRSLFETNLVCVYKARSDLPELRKVKTQEKIAFFPETIPASDLIRLSSSIEWIPGKRVNTELHRAGRIGGLSYVASVPL